MGLKDEYAAIADRLVERTSRDYGVVEWADERLVVDEAGSVAAIDAFKDHQDWAEAHGYDVPGSPHVVGRFMTSLGVKRSTVGGKWEKRNTTPPMVTTYLGIRLKG